MFYLFVSICVANLIIHFFLVVSFINHNSFIVFIWTENTNVGVIISFHISLRSLFTILHTRELIVSLSGSCKFFIN